MPSHEPHKPQVELTRLASGTTVVACTLGDQTATAVVGKDQDPQPTIYQLTRKLWRIVLTGRALTTPRAQRTSRCGGSKPKIYETRPCRGCGAVYTS